MRTFLQSGTYLKNAIQVIIIKRNHSGTRLQSIALNSSRYECVLIHVNYPTIIFMPLLPFCKIQILTVAVVCHMVFERTFNIT